MKEQEHQKKAFEFYYGMGEGRSYRKVADEFGVSVGTVKMWGRSFRWRRRVGERDAGVARAMADKSLKDGTERTARNRKIVEMGFDAFVRTVTSHDRGSSQLRRLKRIYAAAEESKPHRQQQGR